MKKLFKVEIKEVLSDIVEIEAESSEDAEIKAEEDYYDAEYILDGINSGCRSLSFIDIDSPQYLSDDRKEEILNKLIKYIKEQTKNSNDYYDILKNRIGINQNEIENLGICSVKNNENNNKFKEEINMNEKKGKYESVMIFKGDLTEEELNNEIEKIKNFFNNQEVKIESVENLGKKKLAYELKKYTEGNYLVINFKSEAEKIGELERYMRIDDNVLKFIFVKTDEWVEDKENAEELEE